MAVAATRPVAVGAALVAVGTNPVRVGTPGVMVGRLKVAVGPAGVSVIWMIVGDGRMGKVGKAVGVPIKESVQADMDRTVPVARSRVRIRFIGLPILSIFISPW